MESCRELVCRIVTQNLDEITAWTGMKSFTNQDWIAIRKIYQKKGLDSLKRAAEIIELTTSLRKNPEIIYSDDAVLFSWDKITIHLLHETDEQDPYYYCVQTFPGPHTIANSSYHETAPEAIQKVIAVLTHPD